MEKKMSPQLERYYTRKATHRCVNCGAKLPEGYTHVTCEKCITYVRKYQAYKAARMTEDEKAERREAWRVKQKNMRQQRRDKGLCAACASPSGDRYYCASCAAKWKAQQMARNAKK